jgi:hypothetical protein
LELALQETSTGQSNARAAHEHKYGDANLLEKGIAAGITTQEQAESLKGLKLGRLVHTQVQ